MKIRFYLTIVFCFMLSHLALSQNSYNFYYDARSMDTCISNDTGKNVITFFKLLKSYVPSYGYVNIAAIKNDFKLNPFIDTVTFFTSIDTALYYLAKKEIYSSMPKGLTAKKMASNYDSIKKSWETTFAEFTTQFNELNLGDTVNENKEYKDIKKSINSLYQKNHGLTLIKDSRFKSLGNLQDSLKSEYASIGELINYVNILMGTGTITFKSIQSQLVGFQNQSLIIYNIHKELSQLSSIDSQKVPSQLKANINSIIKYVDGINSQINNEIKLVRTSITVKNSKSSPKFNNNAVTKSIADQTLASNMISSSTADLASNSTTPSSGSLESDAIYAAADLIAERFKDELDAYFMQMFDSTLGKSLILKQLLPQTVHLFASDDAYSYVNKPGLIQNAFQKDLSNILPDLDSYMQIQSKEEINDRIEVNSNDSKQIEDGLTRICFELTGQDSILSGINKLQSFNSIRIKTDLAKLKANKAVLKTDTAKLKADEAILYTDAATIKTDTVKLKADMAMQKANTAKLKEDKINKTDTTLISVEYELINDFELNYPNYSVNNIKEKINAINESIKKSNNDLAHYDNHWILSKPSFKRDKNKPQVRELNLLKKRLSLKRDFMILEDKSILQHIHLLFTLIEKIKSSNNPADAVSILGDAGFISKISNNENFKSSCKLGFTVSNGLRDKTKTKFGWVSYDSLNSMNDNERIYFLALFYEKIKNIPFVLRKGDTIKLSQLVNTSDASEIFSYIKEFSNVVSTIDQYHSKDGNISKKDSLSLNNYLGYYKTISNLVKMLYTPPLGSAEDTVITKDVKKLDTISDILITLYSDINQKSWNKITGDLIYLLQATMGDKFQDSPTLLKYGTFVSSVASAKNSNDIKNAIVNVALPPGSYSIKRRSVSNISLNSYVGLAGNCNLFYKSSGYFNTSNTLSNYKIGLSAPVGIAFSWGKTTSNASNSILKFTKSDGQTDYLRGCAWTLFVSVIDLGSIVQVNLSNSQSTVPSQLSIQQFISPGIFLLYDVKNCPLSIIGGLSVRPQLATNFNTGIQSGESSYSNQIAISLGLLIDIPLLNLRTVTDQQF